MYSIIAFDTETTGLPLASSANLSQQPYIIEIGAVKISFDDCEIKSIDNFSELVMCPISITNEITKITGIDDSMVATASEFSCVYSRFKDFVSDANAVIAHNAQFDISMIEFEAARNGITVNLPKVICSAQLYSHMFGGYVKLERLYEELTGKCANQKHRALSDAKLIAEILLLEQIDVLKAIISHE